MAREAFLLYARFQEPIMQLSNESKGMLLTALFEYHKTGAVLELPPDARMAFMFIKNQMDLDNNKYTATCEKRAAAGRKGAETTNNGRQKKQMTANDDKCRQMSANDSKCPPDNEKENEKENENDVVVETTCANTTPTTPTAKNIAIYRTKLAKKFYIKGEDDAFCRAVLHQARAFDTKKIQEMANGVPRSYSIDGKDIWEWSERVDIAVGYRVWIERIVKAWDDGKYSQRTG